MTQKTKKNPQQPASTETKQAELVSAREIASALRLSEIQVLKMAQSNQIPGVKVDGQWRFNKDLVYEAMKRRSRGM